MSATTRAAILRRAVERAVLAPSIHNTQPWVFSLNGDTLEIRADFSRQLRVLDPRRRQLTISCGCALAHIRVAIAAAGHEPIVARLPDPDRPNVLARVSVGRERWWPDAEALERAIDDRRTNRREFGSEPLPPGVVADLVAVARAEGTTLLPITDADQRDAIAALSRQADQIEHADPDYLAELAIWTTDDPRRPDGVQAASIPRVMQSSGEPDTLPIRNFDVHGMGWLPGARGRPAAQGLLLFCSQDDDRFGWLRTGEALEYVWLELTRFGYWASPLTQVVEIRATNERLREALRLAHAPQLLLRVGRAPAVAATPRRSISEVLLES
jgi:nitroreductase